MDEQRKLLDQLMGLDRDLPPEERTGKTKTFSDPEICKHYLCGISPWYAFKNTKSSSDTCKFLGYDYTKVCDDECKAQWDALSQKEKDAYGYEHDLMVLLEKLVAEVDRKIARAHDRIDKENAPTPLTDDEKRMVEAWIEEMRELDEEADKAADDREVDTCEAAVKRTEAVKKMKSDIERSKYPDRKLSVCPVSGIYLSSADSEARRQDHYAGKQYKGWKAIREKLEELKKQNPPPAKGRRNEAASPKHRGRDRDRSYRRDRGDRGYRRGYRRERSRSRERTR